MTNDDGVEPGRLGHQASYLVWIDAPVERQMNE